MTCYYGDAEATAEAIDAQDWLHSGDLGTMDGDGYVRITGRFKKMIIRGGENVYPTEIEACLYEHPKIAQAAVFGFPDKRLGEEIMAWVQPHEGEVLDAETVRAHCAANLAHFKVPRYVWIVDDFPTTVTANCRSSACGRWLSKGCGRRRRERRSTVNLNKRAA